MCPCASCVCVCVESVCVCGRHRQRVCAMPSCGRPWKQVCGITSCAKFAGGLCSLCQICYFVMLCCTVVETMSLGYLLRLRRWVPKICVFISLPHRRCMCVSVCHLIMRCICTCAAQAACVLVCVVVHVAVDCHGGYAQVAKGPRWTLSRCPDPSLIMSVHCAVPLAMSVMHIPHTHTLSAWAHNCDALSG